MLAPGAQAAGRHINTYQGFHKRLSWLQRYLTLSRRYSRRSCWIDARRILNCGLLLHGWSFADTRLRTRVGFTTARNFASHHQTTMKASDMLVKVLEAEGVDRIFGVPGG